MGILFFYRVISYSFLQSTIHTSVYPTRTARFGVALVDAGLIKLKQHEFGQDDEVVQENCPCEACSRGISRKRLHGLLKSGSNTVAIQLLTLHNVTYMMGLVTRMRKSILNETYPDFCREFLNAQYPNPKDVPNWVVEALNAAGIVILRSTFEAKADKLRRNSCFDPVATPDLQTYLKREWDASFEDVVAKQSSSKNARDVWFQKLYQQHNEPDRFYHTAVHLKEILDYWKLLIDQDDSLGKWSKVVVWATFFHDAIYNPRSSQNEKDSAELFEQFWNETLRSDMDTDSKTATSSMGLRKLVVTLIHATEKHQIITDPTMKHEEIELQKVFLDIDMAVLGKRKEAYMVYAGLIRKEYAFVDRSLYCTKRADILKGFLEKKNRIFLSDIFYDALEKQARSNLKDEIELLKRGLNPAEEQ